MTVSPPQATALGTRSLPPSPSGRRGGPDRTHVAAVSGKTDLRGHRTERVGLPSGRFFEFAVVRTGDGDVRVALWGADRLWDEEWDGTFDSVPETERRVQVDGRASLDGLAVGVGERATPTADPPAVGGGDTPTPTDEPFPNVPGDPDSEFDDSGPEQPENSASAPTLLGLIVIGIGAVMIRFGERMDAIGSTTPTSEVEPAAWNVALTKIGGGLVVVFGLYTIVAGFT